MTVHATQKYIRMSARKIRLVADLVRGQELAEINTTLSALNKRAARVVNEVIRQAVANGVNNLGFSETQLSLKSIVVNEGPTYKRVIAKSRGRSGAILKRTSHISVELAVAQTEQAAPTAQAEKIAAPVVEEVKAEPKAEKKTPAKKAPAKKAAPKKAATKTMKKKEA